MEHLKNEEIFKEPRWQATEYDVAFDRVPLLVRRARLLRRITKNCSDLTSYKIKNLSTFGDICVNGKFDGETSIPDAVINRATELLAKNVLDREEGQHLYVAALYLLVTRRKLDFSEHYQYLSPYRPWRGPRSTLGVESVKQLVADETTPRDLGDLRKLIDSSCISRNPATATNIQLKVDDATNELQELEE